MTPGPTPIESFAARCIGGGAVLMLFGVALGAFGAHGLQDFVTPRQLESYRTGVTYQQVHALGLVLLGLVARATPPTPLLRWSAWLLVAGIVFFCGSIYAMTAGAPRWFGAVAPVGGLSFMAAWALLAWHAYAAARPS
jgi:uncharacterized membrane protein YgdD (TMEM256/DUF423 family)